MRRIPLYLLPLALVAVAVAQEAESAADLVKKLGHDDYAVRESATKRLIEMGEDAVPALEEALRHEDLEVRLRAGRALRAIRGVKPDRKEAEEEPAAKEGSDPLGPGGKVVATSLSMSNDKIKLKVTRIDKDGKRVTREYEGKSLEELKKKHPELKGLLGDFNVVVGRDALRGRFDMDRFWKDFGKDFGKEFNDEFWKKWQQDMEQEAERLRKLSERWRRQWGQQWRAPRDGASVWLRRGTRLGAQATRPSRVLDAQLGLRGRGLVLESIDPDSLAGRIGLERYDVLLELNGVAIRQHADVATALKDYKEGAKLTAKVLRRAREQQLTTEKPAAEEKRDGR